MKKTITRKYAISLIKQGKAIPSCFLKPDDKGHVYIAIDTIKTQETKHFVSKEQDLALFLDYAKLEDTNKIY